MAHGGEPLHAHISGPDFWLLGNIQVNSILPILRMFNMPESPRWLLTKGRKEEALKALKFIAGHKNERNCAFIQSEYQEMEARVMEMQQVGKVHFWKHSIQRAAFFIAHYWE